MASRRLLRGLLTFGILASPGHVRSFMVGYRESGGGDIWIFICMKHQDPKVVGELTSDPDNRTCECGNAAQKVKLRPCTTCARILVYTERPLKRTCVDKHHEPPPTLEGGPDDPAENYRKPED